MTNDDATSKDGRAFGAYVVACGFLGESAVFALGDGTVRLIVGESEQSVPAHDGAVLAATLSRDGKALVTGGDDGRVVVTDGAGNAETVAERKGKWIDQLAAGPNGALAFASGRRAEILFGDGRERVFELPRAFGGLAFAPKGLRLAAATYNGVMLWWAGTDADPARLEWAGAHIGVWFSPDGRYLITAMQDNQLHGWRLDDGKDMRMSGYPAKPRSVSWSFKGRFLATSGANAAVLWPFHHKDGPQGKPPLQLGAREVLVTRVACHPRRELVAIGYQDGMVMAVGFADAAETLIRRPGDGPVTALGWNSRGDRLAFGTEQGAGGVRVFGD